MLSIILLSLLLFLVFMLTQKYPGRKYIVGVVLIIFNLLLVEILSYGFLLYRVQQGVNFYMMGNQKLLDEIIKLNLLNRISDEAKNQHSSFEIDNDVGYQPRPDKTQFQYKDTNIQRMRAVHAYYLLPSENRIRLAAFGDSFVYCDGEIIAHSWPYILETTVGNLEVLNFGVSGYGLVQSYQRFINYGLRYNPDIVFFNYVEITDRDQIPASSILGGRNLVNADLYRVNVEFKGDFLFFKASNALDLFNKDFREKFVYEPLGFSSQTAPFANKFFAVSNFGIVLKQWLAPQFWLRSMKTQKLPSLEINLRILRNILRIAKYNQFIVIFFNDKKFDQLPTPIQELLKLYAANAVYINSTELLQGVHTYTGIKKDDLLNETNHFNFRGNQLYAEALKIVFQKRSWGRGERTFRFDPKTQSFIQGQ